jgi:DNA sulfur modification protein DndB
MLYNKCNSKFEQYTEEMKTVGEVLDKAPTDLELNSFATLSAIQGSQFGKEVYSTVIKFNDLHKFLEIFPSVQRDIMPRKVSSMRRYILSGLEETGKVQMRFFSAVTVTCKGHIFYDKNTHRMAIDTRESKLSINDGQHRFESIKTAIDSLEYDYVKCKDKNRARKIRAMIEELSNMVIPVVVFSGLSESEEKMLFHDLNNLAQRPSRNANIRLNQTDKFSIMARELAEENRYLKHYGIEKDRMSIHNGNPNTILLSTVYESIRELLGYEYKMDKSFLNEESYNHYKKLTDETYDQLFYNLPADIDVKGKYLLEKSYTLKAISRFISHARNHLELQLSDSKIFEIIKSIDWSLDVNAWSEFGASETGYGGNFKSRTGNIVFQGGSSGGFKAVYNALMKKATKDETMLIGVYGDDKGTRS